MEITMNQITSELRENIEEKLMPIAKDLREAGWSDKRISGLFRKLIKRETKKFYSQDALESIGDISKKCLIEQTADSKAEVLFYDILSKNNIEFRFQYRIGPYRVDYLMGDTLIVELDGPHHEKQKDYDSKRDSYLRGLGFKILRIPINYVALDSAAVIEGIKEQME